jgi:hypothetical protein
MIIIHLLGDSWRETYSEDLTHLLNN